LRQVFKLGSPYPLGVRRKRVGDGASLLTPKDSDSGDREGYIHAVQAADRDARISGTSDHFGEHVGKAGYTEVQDISDKWTNGSSGGHRSRWPRLRRPYSIGANRELVREL